jgi:hypothetical protein
MSRTYDILVEAIGSDAADVLVQYFAGREIYIPVRAMPNTPLTDKVGEKAAIQLCAHFGGEKIQIPVKVGAESLRERILKLNREGHDPIAIVSILGCTRQYVFRVLSERLS